MKYTAVFQFQLVFSGPLHVISINWTNTAETNNMIQEVDSKLICNSAILHSQWS